MAKRKMILDLDTGVDDALAIAYALADPEVDLIGIVSSYGNNLLRRVKIRIGRGASGSKRYHRRGKRLHLRHQQGSC